MFNNYKQIFSLETNFFNIILNFFIVIKITAVAICFQIALPLSYMHLSRQMSFLRHSTPALGYPFLEKTPQYPTLISCL